MSKNYVPHILLIDNFLVAEMLNSKFDLLAISLLLAFSRSININMFFHRCQAVLRMQSCSRSSYRAYAEYLL